jgi:ribosomal protein S18 acetylase RimI-like enzyme
MQVRPLVAGDRERIAAILQATGHFTADEIATALELIDEWLNTGERSGYWTYVAEDSASLAVLGYVCVGPVPLTEGSYDLYWIAVDPAAQGRGVGRRLLAAAEDVVRQHGGRLLFIETSSQQRYGATIRFYERADYTVAARIAHYYRPNDDKLVFVKDVNAPSGGEPAAAIE